MLKMVDGTGIIGVDMVCPLGGAVSPPQPPNYDNVEMEGVGSLVLPNSLKAPIERLELIGNSVQLTTTGKNLFDESKAVTGRINPDNGELLPETSYISSDYIEVQEGETYFQSGSGDGYYRAFYDMNKKFTSIPTKGIFKITVPVGSKFLRISGRKERFGDWMFEKGDKATPYEPYTGLKSSPSPEYPQEIKSAGKWNEGAQKYEVDVKIANAEQNWSKEQTLTLTSDRPITKWDKLVEQGGQIGWLYASKKYVITGNEIFEPRSGYDQDAYTNRFIVINDLFANRLNDKQLAYCKILKRVQYIYSQNKLEEGIDTNINQLHIKLSNDRIGVLSSDDTETRTAKIAEYIKNTYTDGIEILYATTDTVFLPLSESEQTQLRNLHSYNGTTHVFVDSGEVPCGIKLTYRKEK